MQFDPSFDNDCPQTIQVQGIGDVRVPISLQDAERLLTVAKPNLVGLGLYKSGNKSVDSSWIIERADGILIPKSSSIFHHSARYWMEATMLEHGIDFRAISGECHLTKLAIYSPGSHYIQKRHMSQDLGHFGTLILQIPVEGGHEGGRLKIENRTKTDILSLSSNSDICFYTTFLNVGCVHEMEPIRQGYRIELVYELRWTPKFLGLPNVSTFHLVALTNLTIEFRKWEEKMDNHDSSKMMIIGLEHKYPPEYQSFSTLVGEDRCIAHLILSVHSIDCHLARLIRKETIITESTASNNEESTILSTSKNSISEPRIINTTHSVSHWIDANNCASQFHGLDIDKQATFFNNIFNKFPDPDSVESNDPPREIRLFYRTVLVVWPKKSSFYFNFHHRFDNLLDQMEWGRVPNPLQVLREIISQPVWTKSALRICRLLNLCTSLNAKKEAIQLLNFMADESIGIPSTEAAVLISDLECNLIGWPDCEEVIKKLLVCSKSEQLPHLVTLAQEFSGRNCVNGFCTVSNETWNLFLEQTKTLNNNSDQRTLIAIIQMLIRMEEVSEPCASTKLNQFLSFFFNLPTIQQCQLIIEVTNIYRKNSAGRYLYSSFCRYIAVTIQPWNNVFIDCVVELFRCFLHLDREYLDIIQLFLNNTCQSMPEPSGNNYLLKKLVDSLDKFQDLPDDLALQLLDARIAELDSLHPPEFTWQQRNAKFPDADKYPEVLAFLQSSEKSISIKLNFTKIQDARDFIMKYFGNMEECLEREYSATAEASGKAKSARCRITKTRDLHMAKDLEYKARKQERYHLFRVRQQLCKYETSMCVQLEKLPIRSLSETDC